MAGDTQDDDAAVERRPPRFYVGFAVVSAVVAAGAVAGVPFGWMSPVTAVVLGLVGLGGVILNLYIAIARPGDAVMRRLDPSAEEWRASRPWRILTLVGGLVLVGVGVLDFALYPQASGSFVMVGLGLVMIFLASRALRAQRTDLRS